MKVSATRSARSTDRTGKAAPARNTGEFSATLAIGAADEAPTATSVGSTATLSLIEALTSAQLMGSDPDGRSQAQARGNQLLDRLDELRLALLDGSIPVERLDALMSLVASERAEIQDPGLAATLDEIELLARVELAKLGRDD